MQEASVEPLKEEVVAKIVVGMDFPDAVEKVIEGKMISRTSWPKGEYGVMKDGFLMIVRLNVPYKWNISDGDLLAKDWIIYEP